MNHDGTQTCTCIDTGVSTESRYDMYSRGELTTVSLSVRM
jgi:hypothetical protein